MDYMIEVLIYICIFFPYTKFFNIGVNGNLQPYAFVTTVAFLFIYNKAIKYDRSSKLLMISSVIAILVFFIDVVAHYNEMINIYGAMQSVYFYISGFLYFLAFKNLIRIKGIKLTYIKIIFWIWTIIAGIQLVYDRTFFTGWMNKLIISSDRGVISLSSEPSFFARMLILFAVIFYVKKQYKLCWLAVFENIFFARSLLGIFYLLIGLFFLFEKDRKTLRYICILTGIAVIVFPFTLGFENIRAIYLLKEFLLDPVQVLLYRNSINFRLANVYYGFKGFGFLPNGFLSWENYLWENLMKSDIFLSPLAHESLRIKGMLPRIVYELGIFSALILYSIKKMFKKRNYRNMIYFFTIMTFGFTNPAYVFVLAFLSNKDSNMNVLAKQRSYNLKEVNNKCE
ncbi:hypothetical protein IZY60_13765 [Lutibacter sp. B2]|nr:hypothetical protein [Lutibacter sp. B2]